MTVGAKFNAAADAWIAGTSPLPVRATVFDGLTGSLVPTLSVAERAPAALGLKRTVSVKLDAFAIETGRTGAPTIEKSPAFGPVIESDVRLSAQLPVLPMVTVRSAELGEVRLSVATPLKSSAFELIVTFAAPTVPLIGTEIDGLFGSSVETTTLPAIGPPPTPEGAKRTVNVRLAPTAIVCGRLGLGNTDKPGVAAPPIVTLLIVSGAWPVLVT